MASDGSLIFDTKVDTKGIDNGLKDIESKASGFTIGKGIMSNLAAASGEDLAATSDIVTDALTAFGMQAEEAGHFADILATASSKSNTNVSMMGETFKYVAPVAGALGYSYDTGELTGFNPDDIKNQIVNNMNEDRRSVAFDFITSEEFSSRYTDAAKKTDRRTKTVQHYAARI